MCFNLGSGGGKTAEEYYADLREETPRSELPSLRNIGERSDRPEQVLSDVPRMRKGSKIRSSLLMGVK